MINATIKSHKVYNVTSIKDKFGFRVVLYFEDGTSKTKQHSGFKSKAEAESFREKVISDLVNKSYVYKNAISIEMFLIDWFENKKKPYLAYNSYMTYRNCIYNYIIPRIGKLKIGDLKKDNLRKLFEDIETKSAKIASISRTIIKTSLNVAICEGYLVTNPVEGLKLKKDKNTDESAHITVIDEKKVLTLEQTKILIEGSKDTKIHLQILFAVLMGLRRGEINGLKYSDIDYSQQKLHIQRQLGKLPPKVEEETKIKPKTKSTQEIKLKTYSSNRVVDIPDIVFEAILAERVKYEKNRNRRKREFRNLDYICCSTYGKPRSTNFLWSHYKKLLKDCGLPDIRFHDLRHTYATLLTKNGFNLKAISKLLGHSREIITSDVYIEKYEIIEDCTKELSDYIESVIPKHTSLPYDEIGFKNLIPESDMINDYIEMFFSKESCL